LKPSIKKEKDERECEKRKIEDFAEEKAIKIAKSAAFDQKIVSARERYLQRKANES
jgi:hypothetical protein